MCSTVEAVVPCDIGQQMYTSATLTQSQYEHQNTNQAKGGPSIAGSQKSQHASA
jgi:hypothetical protein